MSKKITEINFFLCILFGILSLLLEALYKIFSTPGYNPCVRIQEVLSVLLSQKLCSGSVKGFPMLIEPLLKWKLFVSNMTLGFSFSHWRHINTQQSNNLVTEINRPYFRVVSLKDLYCIWHWRVRCLLLIKKFLTTYKWYEEKVEARVCFK